MTSLPKRFCTASVWRASISINFWDPRKDRPSQTVPCSYFALSAYLFKALLTVGLQLSSMHDLVSEATLFLSKKLLTICSGTCCVPLNIFKRTWLCASKLNAEVAHSGPQSFTQCARCVKQWMLKVQRETPYNSSISMTNFVKQASDRVM